MGENESSLLHQMKRLRVGERSCNQYRASRPKGAVDGLARFEFRAVDWLQGQKSLFSLADPTSRSFSHLTGALAVLTGLPLIHL